MITLTRNIIKKINRNLVGFKSEVEVGFDKQSNDRILLDIAIKLYDDEVFRYRYIEDKALKIATIVIFIATTLTALITWMATRDIGMVGQLINFGFSLSAIFVIACLLYVYEVLSENDESLSAISLSDLDINNISDSSKYYDDFYETLLSKYSERIVDYKDINAKKTNSVDCAYRYLGYLLLYLVILGTMTIIHLIINGDYLYRAMLFLINNANNLYYKYFILT